MATGADVSEEKTRTNMDRMYRWTRHIYDASRKYYLLGRDALISGLKPSEGEHIIEVGCGTARNLAKLRKAYPNVSLYGLDASGEMLKTAERNLERRKAQNVMLAQDYAQSFSPRETFGLDQAPDKIIFSYALSIIPPWRESIDHALSLLDHGGEIHIVDFGGQESLPRWFSRFLFWWLKKFHVYHKPEILAHLQKIEKENKGALKTRDLYKGYAYYAVFKKS